MNLFINNDHLNIQPIDASNYNHILYFKDGVQCHYSIDKEGKITFIGVTNGTCNSINKRNLNPLPFKTIQEWNFAIKSNHTTKAKIKEFYSHCRIFNERNIYQKRVTRIFTTLTFLILFVICYAFQTNFEFGSIDLRAIALAIGIYLGLIIIAPLVIFISYGVFIVLPGYLYSYFWEGE